MDMLSVSGLVLVSFIVGAVIAIITDRLFRVPEVERINPQIEVKKAKICVCDTIHDSDSCPRCGSPLSAFVVNTLGTVVEEEFENNGEREAAMKRNEERHKRYIDILNGLRTESEPLYEPEKTRLVVERYSTLWKKSLH